MKFHFTIKGWEFFGYKWHSINLIPQFSRATICDDGENGYKTCGMWISAIFLGYIFNIQYPTTKFASGYSSPLIGPRWSRRHKKWYMHEQRSA